MTKPCTQKDTETTVTQLLRSKYSGQHWAFVAQVPNGTAMNKSRTCDGMAMGLWPSKGLHLHGFEIKVSRSDWLAEIQLPEKAVAFSRYCHFWWIVAPPGIIKLEEVAAEWGVQEVTKSGQRLRVKKAASLLSLEPVGPDLLAGIFRACARQGSESEIKQARRDGYDAGHKDGYKSGKQWVAHDGEGFQREAERWRRVVKEFEEASGIAIQRYGGGDLGSLVAKARAIQNAESEMDRLRTRAQGVLDTLTAADRAAMEESDEV